MQKIERRLHKGKKGDLKMAKFKENLLMELRGIRKELHVIASSMERPDFKIDSKTISESKKGSKRFNFD